MTVGYPLLHLTDRQDIFSFAFILAVVGSAGYNYGRDSLDRDSEDLYVKHRAGESFIPTYKRLGIQAKCTYYYKQNEKGTIPFVLHRKNYDDLRRTTEPHILVVVTVPDRLVGCTEFGPDHLLLRHRAYWLSLKGFPAIPDEEQQSTTIHIPTSQEFTVETLHDLMAMIAEGNRP